jgi:hypothetical protein
LIPNYSEKSKDASAVGEMGNGSYQMYRDAEIVTLKTRTLDNPPKVYLLRIVPVRNEKGKVIDLRHTCVDVTESNIQFMGTELTIVYLNKREKSRTAIELAGLRARSFIQHTIGCADVILPAKKKIEVLLKFPKESVAVSEIDHLSAKFTTATQPFSLVKLKGEEKCGYVLTDGYPFIPLANFLKEEKLLPDPLIEDFAKGWCLNLPKGSYKPVQSRTRVQLTDETKKQLKLFLMEFYYYLSFNAKTARPGKRYYPHFESTGPFDQVFPGETLHKFTNPKLLERALKTCDFQALEEFFLYYTPSFLQQSFFDYVNTGYNHLVANLNNAHAEFCKALNQLTVENRETKYQELLTIFHATCDQHFKNWNETLQPMGNMERIFFAEILKPWFENKFIEFKKGVPALSTIIQKNDKIATQQEKEEKMALLKSTGATLQEVFKEPETKKAASEINKYDTETLKTAAILIIQTYCNLYTNFHALKPIEIKLYFDEASKANAFYNSEFHQIHVNVAHIPLSSILKLGREIQKGKILTNNPLISIQVGSSGTLNHELEHVRRGASCKGAHAGGMNYEETHYLDFENCAGSYAKASHQCGLMEEWAKTLSATTLPSKNMIAELNTIETKSRPVLPDLLSLPKEG